MHIYTIQLYQLFVNDIFMLFTVIKLGSISLCIIQFFFTCLSTRYTVQKIVVLSGIARVENLWLTKCYIENIRRVVNNTKRVVQSTRIWQDLIFVFSHAHNCVWFQFCVEFWYRNSYLFSLQIDLRYFSSEQLMFLCSTWHAWYVLKLMVKCFYFKWRML